ncbi:hypothetical protein AGLY_010689 [Aphis glycines]|uniref:Uncharacterized protein n=1 Tax=Aphis glycines TaxID=307491 RepID=A0A6G0TGH2_APHGL|nr:hypothetical protein AGLY_010689 [Aphis glycines]
MVSGRMWVPGRKPLVLSKRVLSKRVLDIIQLNNANAKELPCDDPIHSDKDNSIQDTIQSNNANAINNRKKAKQNLENQAVKMKTWSNKKLKPAEVGATVRVPVPDVDKGRGDARNILAVVIEEGLLKSLYSRSQFTICQKNLIAIEEVPRENTFALRTIATQQSTGTGQGFIKCTCKTKCQFISDVGSVSAFLFDDGVETVVVVSGVFDNAGGTVGFQEAVKAFYVTVAVAGLGLTLDVVSARVVYAVHKAVRRRFVDGCNWNSYPLSYIILIWQCMTLQPRFNMNAMVQRKHEKKKEVKKRVVCWFVCWFVGRGRVCWCWVSWGSIGWCGVSWLVGWCGVSWLVGWCGVSWGLVSTFVLDDGIETVVVVSGVFNGTGGTVSFQKAVRSLDVTVAVAVFGLALDVVCGWVVYAVFEVVWGWCVSGFWSVGLWCGVSWCRVSWCRVSGLVSWGGVLGESRSHASGEDDQLEQKNKTAIFVSVCSVEILDTELVNNEHFITVKRFGAHDKINY